MSHYTITLNDKILSGKRTKVSFSSINESISSERVRLEKEQISLISADFPDKLNQALKALELFRAWFSGEDIEKFFVLDICIEGDPFYAFFIIKDLLATQTNFRIKIDSDFLETADYMVTEFREFVIDAASLDFSKISSSLTLDYPSSFTKCFGANCRHEKKNFLSNLEKFLGISIVIPTRDVPNAWLEKLLTQVTAQMNSLDELILIDDNDIKREFGNLTHLHANLRILRGTRNGVSSARNLGVTETSKELVLFIDSDDEILPGFIESQRSFHMKFRNVSATGVWLQAFGSHSRIYPQWDGFSPLGIYQCLPPAGVLMWKKEALNQIGEFRSDFAKGFEDFDLVARAIASDHLIVTFERIKYLYRRGHGSLTQSLKEVDQSELSKLVWRNAKKLCDHNFIKFVDLGLSYGGKMSFDSVNYIFFGSEKSFYLSRFARKVRNSNLAKNVWALIPLKLRRPIFNFFMKH